MLEMVTLNEADIAEQIKVLERAGKKAAASKSAALKSLKEAGIVTNSGKLTKRYGGK